MKTGSGGTYSVLTTGFGAPPFVVTKLGDGTNLVNGTTYYFKITAVKSGVESAYSNEAYATPAAPSAPSTPTGLTASATSSTSIHLTWGASTGATIYRLQRKTGLTGTWNILSSPTSTSYDDTGLSPSTTYYYRVRAVANDLSSTYSGVVQETTEAVILVSETIEGTSYSLWPFGAKIVSAECSGNDELYDCSCSPVYLRKEVDVENGVCSCVHVPLLGCGLFLSCPTITATASCLSSASASN